MSKHNKILFVILIILVIIIIILGILGFHLFHESEVNKSSNIFHASDYMNDQKSFNSMMTSSDFRNLDIDPHTCTLFNRSNNKTIIKGGTTVVYGSLPAKNRLMINHISKINHNGIYKIYWSTMHNTKIISNGHTFNISPIGSKDHVFNKYNLNHEGYFILSTKKEPQLATKAKHLYYMNSRMLKHNMM